MRVATIRHAPFEGAGAIAAWAVDRGHGFATTMAATEAFPAPADYDLLVVMGGPMSANDEARFAWLAAEKTAVRAGIDAGKRVLGVCLGAQIVASVLGAAVTRNPEPEIGWFPVTLTSASRTSRVFGSLPNSLVAGHWHSDIFALPEGAVRIAGSEACANQAFEYDEGRVVGVQFHLEWTAQGAQALVEHCSADLVPGMHVVTAEGFIAGEAEHGVSARTALYALLDAMTGVRE